jgi:hypothetical protein
MQVITFAAEMKDGIIKVPKERVQEVKALQNFNVIIVGESQQAPIRKKRRKLTSLKIDTRDIVFDRDEANER